VAGLLAVLELVSKSVFDDFTWVGGRLSSPITEGAAEAVCRDYLACVVTPSRSTALGAAFVHAANHGGQGHVRQYAAAGSSRVGVLSSCENHLPGDLPMPPLSLLADSVGKGRLAAVQLPTTPSGNFFVWRFHTLCPLQPSGFRQNDRSAKTNFCEMEFRDIGSLFSFHVGKPVGCIGDRNGMSSCWKLGSDRQGAGFPTTGRLQPCSA